MSYQRLLIQFTKLNKIWTIQKNLQELKTTQLSDKKKKKLLMMLNSTKS